MSVTNRKHRPVHAGPEQPRLAAGEASHLVARERIKWVNIGFAVLIVADAATLGTWAIRGLIALAQSNAADRALLASASPIASPPAVYAGFLAAECAVAYFVFPLQFLDSRLGLRAYRMLCATLLVLHVPLLIGIAWDVWRHGASVLPFVAVPASIALLGTPLLLPIARFLFDSGWGVPLPDNVPSSGRVGGSSAAASPAGAPPLPSPGPSGSNPVLAALLPFVACFRTGRYGFAAVTLLLWLGTIYFLLVAPPRAIVPFAIAAGIGIRVGGSSRARVAATLASRPLPLAGLRDDAIVLGGHGSAPPALAAGLLSIPPLVLIDTIAVMAFWGINYTGELTAYVGFMQGICILLLVAYPLVMIPVMMFVPAFLILGNVVVCWLFRLVCGGLALLHLGLTALYVASSFGIGAFGYRITLPDSLQPLLLPLTVALLLLAPMAVVLAWSLPTAQRAAVPSR